MSARKTEVTALTAPTTCLNECLTLPADTVRIRKSGIEFWSDQPLPLWTEMTVSLQIPREIRKVHCTGVIVACSGNRTAGYQISMLFTNLTPKSQLTLKMLAR